MHIESVFWLWISIAILFAIIEFSTATFFGLWMAIAALVPAGLVLLAPATTMVNQLLIWALASVICSFVWVKWIRSKPADYVEPSLTGQEGILSQALEQGEIAQVLLSKPIQGQQEWPCYSSESLPRQTRVRIISLNEQGQVEVVKLSTIEE
jgi:inner membrane protein